LTGPDLDRLEEDLHVTLLGHCENSPMMQAISLPQALLIAHRFLYRWMPRLVGAEPFLPEHLDIVQKLEAGHVTAAATLFAGICRFRVTAPSIGSTG
jgi:DNA-binding GntR family transcriptional regulator